MRASFQQANPRRELADQADQTDPLHQEHGNMLRAWMKGIDVTAPNTDRVFSLHS